MCCRATRKMGSNLSLALGTLPRPSKYCSDHRMVRLPLGSGVLQLGSVTPCKRRRDCPLLHSMFALWCGFFSTVAHRRMFVQRPFMSKEIEFPTGSKKEKYLAS